MKRQHKESDYVEQLLPQSPFISDNGHLKGHYLGYTHERDKYYINY